MRIIADTNLLVRAAVRDDAEGAARAEAELARASRVVVPLVVLCEVGWVLRSAYRYTSEEIASVLRGVIEAENVETERMAAGAGLRMLDAGGDFADGVIAASGAALGGEVFVSFDRQAVQLLREAGVNAREPGGSP